MVSVFKSVEWSSKVMKNSSVDKMLDYISKSNDNVERLRQYSRDSQEYKQAKKKLYCVTWCASFNENRVLEDLNELTGLVYLDFDNQEVNKDEYTYAQWKSLSGKGYGKLVKVEGLNKNNFKSTVEALRMNYSTSDDLKDYTRLNILSSDKDLYVNDSAKTYQAVEPIVKEYKPNLITIDVNSNDYITKACQFAYNIAKKNGKRFGEGDKHNSAISFLTSCNKLGVAEYDALSFLNKIMYSDLNESRAKDVYRRYNHQFRTLLYNG